MRKIPFEKHLVHHAYENVIDRCARLNSFSSEGLVRNLETEDIWLRETTLAIDDLITLAINARRLLSVCHVPSHKINMRVSKWQFRFTDEKVLPEHAEEFLSLQQVFGVIIHCEMFQIISSDKYARLFLSENPDPIELLALYASQRLKDQVFNPKVLLESDHSEKLILDIGEIVSCIDMYLCPAVVEIASKQGLELGQQSLY